MIRICFAKGNLSKDYTWLLEAENLDTWLLEAENLERDGIFCATSNVPTGRSTKLPLFFSMVGGWSSSQFRRGL